MSLDNLISFPKPRAARPDSPRALTERRVIAQWRHHLKDPIYPADDCLIEYRRLAVSSCREHIATLVELDDRQALLRVNHWLFEAMKHLKGITK